MADLSTQVRVLEMEAVAAALATGRFPTDLGRAPTAVEVASQVDFASIANRLDAGRNSAVRIVRRALVGAITALQADLQNQYDLGGLLRRFASYTTGGLAAPIVSMVTVAAEDQLAEVLQRVSEAGLAEVYHEARQLGVIPRNTPTPGPSSALLSGVRGQAAGLSARIQAEAIRLMADAIQAEPFPADLNDVEGYARRVALRAKAAQTRGLDDVAAQTINGAQGMARTEGSDVMDHPEVTAHASELLDRNTCGPCRGIDGTRFGSLAEALAAYPSGRFAGCLGGDRCRGQVIFNRGAQLRIAAADFDVAFAEWSQD